MKLTRILSMTAIALVALTGCHKSHQPYPQGGGQGGGTSPSKPEPEPEVTLTEVRDWNVEYQGRKCST